MFYYLKSNLCISIKTLNFYIIIRCKLLKKEIEINIKKKYTIVFNNLYNT
jgi:hypothetical protein